MSKLDFTRGEVIAAKYEVVDVLEESPLGITYRVKHQKSGKFVRLTMLRPKHAGRDQKNQLLDIYRRVKDLSHPALAKIGELGEHEGVAYFTAEDFEGNTLRDLVTEYKVEGKQLGVREAAQIALQMLEGMDVLHKQGFFIRGMRPEYVLVNVKRTGPRNANIVAKVKLTGSGFWDLVPAGVLAEDEFARGESQYLAPEMKSFEPVPSARADIYSTGVMFYEMLTGVAPLGTFQMPAAIRPDLPKIINEIIELALANAPDDRYQTASDFMAAIQRTMSDAEVSDDGSSRTRVWPVILGGFAIVFALAVIGYISLFTGPKPDDIQKAADVVLRNEVKEKVQAKIPSQAEIIVMLKNHPDNMAYIPAGPFAHGRMNYDPDAASGEPLAVVTETPAFVIDKFEYPNLLGAKPKNNVDYGEAEQLCSEQGKRLCTNLEWEKACKGLINAVYAYETSVPADTFDPSFCGDGLVDAGYPSGQLTSCKSSYGVYDMSGNFREWTASAPPGKEKRRYVKGGQGGKSAQATRCSFETDESSLFKDDGMSFRCCRNIDAPPYVPPAPQPAPDAPKTP